MERNGQWEEVKWEWLKEAAGGVGGALFAATWHQNWAILLLNHLLPCLQCNPPIHIRHILVYIFFSISMSLVSLALSNLGPSA